MSKNEDFNIADIIGALGSPGAKGGGKPPTEPTADARAAARETFNMFSAFVDAGFTRGEALGLVSSMLQMQVAAAIQGDDEE